jgi:hypothetical protein
MSDTSDAPVSDLDLEAVGRILVRLPAISRRVGHDGPRATLGYVADTTPEGNFVRDIFTLTAQEMAEKWYGGEAGAQRYGRELAEAVSARIPRRVKS